MTGVQTCALPIFVMATKGEISEQNDLVQAWFDFVLGDEGQQVASEVGLITVK